MPVADHFAERAQLLRLVLGCHRPIRVVPIAEHSKALEIRALQVDLLLRILATFVAKRSRIQFLTRAAEFLLYLQLDRQTVAIPSGDVGRVETVERARFDD